MTRRPLAWLVTGTDTGAGKTWASLALIEALQIRGYTTAGMKPVATGCERDADGRRVNDDARRLRAAGSVSLDAADVNPYAFVPPIAPHLAAAEAGVEIDVETIAAALERAAAQADALVVEGVGGWTVPLGPALEVGDIARRLALPVILVVALRLGCLNHALLTARQIQADGAHLAGWIAAHTDPDMDRAEGNVAALAARLPAPLLGRLPHVPAPNGLGRSLDPSALLA